MVFIVFRIGIHMDKLLIAADIALRTLFATPRAVKKSPSHGSGTELSPVEDMSDDEKKLASSLMRVNHVGEICAQALYTAQAFTTKSAALREQFQKSADEEIDHLAWTKERLDELGSRPSLLNPLWYAGAFALGVVAGKVSDKVSLGFVVETEKQVAEHLAGHLNRLPASDGRSRAIVSQMKADEEAHALAARRAGGVDLPAPVRTLMRAAAKVMTTTAHHI